MKGICVPVDALAKADVAAMWRVFAACFMNVDEAGFRADLAAKDRVVLLHGAGGSVAGFTSFALYDSEAPGYRVRVLYSGDTVVAPTCWGTSALARTWLAAVDAERRRLAGTPFYWLLVCSGFRTYRFLPVFWERFIPRAGSTDPELAALARILAAERFGGAYDPATGILRFERPQLLAPGLDEVPENRRHHPDVATFLRSNPGWRRGDELVCLAELSPARQTAACRRLLDWDGAA